MEQKEKSGLTRRQMLKLTGVGALALGISGSGIFAYFTAEDAANNTLTIAKDLVIDVIEPSWDPEAGKNLVPAQVVAKDPAIKNVSTINGYVAIEVRVPQAAVQIFDEASETVLPATKTPLFSYVANSKWQLVEEFEDGDELVRRYLWPDVVGPDGVTEPIFDEIKFANLIQGQGQAGHKVVVVNGYGIQADPFEDATSAWNAYRQQNGLGDGVVSDPVVDGLMESMDLHQKVCQMFCVYPENLLNDAASGTLTAMNDTAVQTLADYPFGGVCVFLKNITSQSQAKAMTDAMQAASSVPMFISVDEEGGRVQRIGGTTYDGAVRGAGIGHQLNAMQTYASEGAETAYSNAQKLAYNCNLIGCNWDYAPVADVNSNPNNPIIGARAYSSDYEEASTLISSAIRGFHDSGVATSIKHFPGHGDTGTDSHYGIAEVNKDLDQLRQEDLVPFAAGIAAGTDSVMVGHLAIKGAEGIASTSKELITDLLRGEMGFDGVVVTDGMGMGAMTTVYGNNQAGYIAAVKAALNAGVDVFLLPGTPRAAVDALEASVASGEITEARIDASVRRILQMKKNRGIIS